MKWFFDLFKNNEEEEIDREHNSQNVMDRKKEWNKGREMETRISYQYPKGEFRFPLIPDDDRETKKHPSLRERDRKQEINVPIPTAKIKVEPVIKQKKVKLRIEVPDLLNQLIFLLQYMDLKRDRKNINLHYKWRIRKAEKKKILHPLIKKSKEYKNRYLINQPS